MLGSGLQGLGLRVFGLRGFGFRVPLTLCFLTSFDAGSPC